MSDTAATDRAVERDDTRRELANAGIRDEDLVDAIIDTLVDEGAVHWQDAPGVYVGPLSEHGGLDPEHLHRIVTVAVQETAQRIAQDIRERRDAVTSSVACADVVLRGGVVRVIYNDAADIAAAHAARRGVEAGR